MEGLIHSLKPTAKVKILRGLCIFVEESGGETQASTSLHGLLPEAEGSRVAKRDCAEVVMVVVVESVGDVECGVVTKHDDTSMYDSVTFGCGGGGTSDT